jgi:hypothetical protein
MLNDDEGILDGSGLGLEDVPEGTEDDPLAAVAAQPVEEATPSPPAAPVAVEPETPPAPPPPEEPEAPAEPTPTPEAGEAAAVEEEQVPETPAVEYEHENLKTFMGGKYRTFADAEAAMKSLQGMSTRTFQEKQRIEQAWQEAEARNQQIAPFVRQYLEQAQKGQTQGPTIEQLDEETDPAKRQQMFQQMLDQAVEQRVGPVEQRIQQERQRQEFEQLRETTKREVAAFYAENDGLQDTPEDAQLAELLGELRETTDDEYPWTKENLNAAYKMVQHPKARQLIDDLGLDPRDYVDTAIEAVQNPTLEKYVRLNPAALTSPELLAAARDFISTPGAAPAPTQEQRDEEARRNAAFSESARTGAPVQTAPGQLPENDLMSQMARQAAAEDVDSPLFQ